MDYKEILRKFMQYIWDENEGISFQPPKEYPNFSKEELDILKQINDELFEKEKQYRMREKIWPYDK